MVRSRCFPFFAGVLAVLIAGLGPWTSPALGDELKEAQDKLIILEAAKDFVLRRLSAMNNVIDEYEAALKTLKAKIDIEKPEFDYLKKRLRELDQLIAKVRSPYELAEAYAKYKKSAKTVQDFKEYFTFVRGKQPDQTQIEQRHIEETIIEKEIRNKAVVALGPALIEIGKLINTFIDFGRNNAPGTIRMRELVDPSDLFDGLEKLSAIKPMWYSVYQGIQISKDLLDTYSGWASGFVDPALDLMSAVASEAKIMSKETQNYIWSKVERPLHFIPQIGMILVQKNVGAMAEKMFNEANACLYGTPDREGTSKYAQQAKQNLTEALQTVESRFLPVLQEYNRLEPVLQACRNRHQQIVAEYRKILSEIESLENKISELQAQERKKKAQEENRNRPKPRGKITETIAKLEADTPRLGMDEATCLLLPDAKRRAFISYEIHYQGQEGQRHILVDEGGSLFSEGAVSLKGLKVIPIMPGKGTVHVQCDDDQQAIQFEVVKLVGLEIKGLPERVDFILSNNKTYRGWVEARFTNGQTTFTQRVSPRLLEFRWEDPIRPLAYIERRDQEFELKAGATIGKSKVTISLRGFDDFQQSFSVQASYFETMEWPEPDVVVPSGLLVNEFPVLVGSPLRIKLRACGGVDMSGYRPKIACAFG